MSKSGLGNQDYVIGYKRRTKCINNFKGEPQSKLETTKGTKFVILPKEKDKKLKREREKKKKKKRKCEINAW